ncbi:MAG: hypothetical protein K2O03_11930 [Lachnospiraceae bacterium]|nr:hypothetical protein [Lachnospiraceae bacterium]
METIPLPSILQKSHCAAAMAAAVLLSNFFLTFSPDYAQYKHMQNYK